MSEKYSWKAVAKSAKKWVDNKVTETTTANRQTRDHAAGNEEQIERELEAAAGGAVLTTLFPGLGRAIERQEEHRQRAAAEGRERDHARRSATVLAGASVDLRGSVNGHADDLAVTFTPDEELGTLTVLFETVDPVHFDGAELSAAGFAITGYHGDGTYALSSDTELIEPGAHHVVFNDGDSDVDWYYWTDEYGPAQAVVSGGVIAVSMVCRNAGSEQIAVELRVPLG